MTTDFKAISPPVFRDLAHASSWSQRTLIAHQTLDATAIKGPSTGINFAMNTGRSSVTGELDGIASGLSTIASIMVSIDNATPVNYWVTSRVSPLDVSKLDIFVWKPTAAGDTTPIPATVA